MKAGSVTACFLAALFFPECASTGSDIYDRERVSLVSSWVLSYSYAYAETEAPVSPWDPTPDFLASQEPRTDLRLADEIFFRVRTKSPVPVFEHPKAAEGRIHLHALLFATGGCKAIDISFYDRTGQLLARRILRNRTAPQFGYDDSFADDASRAILDLLKTEPPYR